MALFDAARKGVESLVDAFSPRRAGERAVLRAAEQAHSRFTQAWDNARSGRRSWIASSGSADTDLDEDTLPRLRERSRDRYRNDALAASVVNALADNIVGSGFRPVLRLDPKALGITPTKARDLQEQAKLLWREWTKSADSTGVQHFDQMQHLVMASTLVNGDVFATPLMMAPPVVRRSRFELKIELLEGDRVDTPIGLRQQTRRTIRNGVELNRNGAPIAYWVAQMHPGDENASLVPGDRLFRRVPRINSTTGRPNLMHVFEQPRVGQSRGTPLLSAVLDLFKDRDDFIEARLIREQVAACFAAFIKKNDPYTAAIQRAASDSTSGTSPRDEEIIPGTMNYLQPGEDIEFASPTSGGSDFDQFIATVSRAITSALGMPYEVATRDFSGTTYAQARASLLEARRMFQRRQRWLVNAFLQPIWEMVLEEAWLKRLWEAVDFAERIDLWTNTMWVPPGWGWIDPQKESAAWEKALDMKVTTRSKIVAAQDGDDFENVARQLAEEDELLDSLGMKPAAPGEDDSDEEESPSSDDAGEDDEEPENEEENAESEETEEITK